MLVIREKQMQEMSKSKTAPETGSETASDVQDKAIYEYNGVSIPLKRHNIIYRQGWKEGNNLTQVCSNDKSEKKLKLIVKAKIHSTGIMLEGVKFDFKPKEYESDEVECSDISLSVSMLEGVKFDFKPKVEYSDISLSVSMFSPEGIPSSDDFYFDNSDLRVSDLKVSKRIAFPYSTDKNGEYEYPEPLLPEGHYEIKLVDTIIITDISQKKTPYICNWDPQVYRTQIDADGVQMLEVIIYYIKLECIIDSHMHIMSGHCTPLPIVWKLLQDNLFGINIHPPRPDINVGAYVRYLGAMQKESTSEIAEKALELNDKSYDRDWDKCILLTPMVALTMDMEYAHIDGYKGKKIYCRQDKNKEGKITAYYYKERDNEGNIKKFTRFNDVKNRLSPVQLGYDRHLIDDPAKTGDALFELSFPIQEIFHDWDIQINQTKASVVKHPWKLLPMYHYDPRRWIKNPLEPFKNIATDNNKGLFIGFKMYTSLGYRPLDLELIGLHDFYCKCETLQIPIINHCTPGGSYTHEREFYLKYAKDNNYLDIKDYTDPIRYFQDKFVRPKAWDDVLLNYSNLKLCLAHFGDIDNWRNEIIGMIKKYNNFYTDISYVFFDKEYRNKFSEALYANLDIKDKILFGTDWYVIRGEDADGHDKGDTYKGNVDYSSYCQTAKAFIDKMSEDKGIDFWKLFTHDNPFRFFGFDNEKKLMNIGKALLEEYALLLETDVLLPDTPLIIKHNSNNVRRGFYLMNRLRMALSEEKKDSTIKII